MSKQESFLFAGVCIDNKNKIRIRYTNNLENRIKRLTYDKFKFLKFINLGKKMSKLNACFVLNRNNDFANYKANITHEINKHFI